MRTLKIIITNLILILALVILTGTKVVYADNAAFEITGVKSGGSAVFTLHISGMTFAEVGNLEIYYNGKLSETIDVSTITGDTYTLKGSYEEGAEITISQLIGVNEWGDVWHIYVPKGFGSSFDYTKFGVEKIERINGIEKYRVHFTHTVGEMVDANYSQDIQIGIYDIKGNFISEINQGIQIFGLNRGDTSRDFSSSDTPLYKYGDTVIVRFSSTGTGLLYDVEAKVPQLDNINDLHAKFGEYNGTIYGDEIVLYNPSNAEYEYTTAEIWAMLGLDDQASIEAKLYAGDNVIAVETNREMFMGKGDNYPNSFSFTSIRQFVNNFEYNFVENLEELKTLDLDRLAQLLAFHNTMGNYYKLVKNGELKLYIGIKDSNGDIIKFEIDEPNMGSNHNYFDTVVSPATDFEEYGAFYEALLNAIKENAVDASGGKIDMYANEAYKIFYLNDDGIYYIYLVDDLEGAIPRIFPAYTDNTAGATSLAFAGRLTGEYTDYYMLGEYVSYYKGKVSYSADVDDANCFPIIGGALYLVENKTGHDVSVYFEKVAVERVSSGNKNDVELVEIIDNKAQDLKIYQSEQTGYDKVIAAHIVESSKDTLFDKLEHLLAWCVRSLANGLITLVNYAAQYVSGSTTPVKVDIDSIIFNHYPDTSIAFFKSNTGSDSPSKMIELFRYAVNKWYNVFFGIAVAGYIVILLYIGVRILLKSTGKDKSKYKEMLTGWALGILILVFYPYAMRYIIEINNLLVAEIESSKSGALNIPDEDTSVDVSDFNLPSNLGDDVDAYKVYAMQMDANPYEGSNSNSYMSFIANRAHETDKLVDAVVYLIMVWQLIMILIMYYKRVFTIAFLIVVFPFVALSYAVDKVGDGKAQGFSVWAKEFTVNVFTQSIHAIVYVFVIGATYVGGSYGGDWLLSIIGISFLFKCEEILKKIIGQEASTAKTLQQTAQRTVATVTAARLVAKKVGGNVIGAKSHLGDAINASRMWRTEKRTARSMDVLTPTRPPYVMGSRDSLPTFDPSLMGNTEYNELADDILYFNDRDNADDIDRLAKSFDNIMAHKDSVDPEIQKLMESLNLSPEQLDEFSKMFADVSEIAYSSDTSDPATAAKVKETMDQEITARLKIIMPGITIGSGGKRKTINTENLDRMKSVVLRVLSNSDMDEKHRKRAIDIPTVKAEIQDARNRRNSFFNPEQFSNNGFLNPFSESAREREIDETIRDEILNDYFGGASGASDEKLRMAGYLSMIKEFSDMSKSGARPISTDKFSARQMMQAVNYVARYSSKSEEATRAIDAMFSNSASDIRAMVAEEVGKQFTNLSDYDRKNFRKDLKRGEKTRVVSSIFYNAENAKSKGIDNPFADCDEAVPLNNNEISRAGLFATDIYHKRLRDLTDDERKTVENLAILEEFSRQSDITDNVDRNKHTTVQVLDAANYFAQHKDETGTFDEALKKYLGASKDELVDTVAEEIARVYKNPEDEINRHYVGTPGPEADLYKQKIEEGLSSKIYIDDSVSAAEIKRALKDNREAYDMATRVFNEEEKDEKSRHYCEETMQKVGIRDAMRKDREDYYDDETYASYLVVERKYKNEEEMITVEDIARELLDDLPNMAQDNSPRYEGLTKEEHEQLAIDNRKKFEEELVRAGTTTVGAVLGGIVGAGISIGLNDDDSAVGEGLKGAVVGSLAADTAVEKVLGDKEKTKKIKVVNPYTKEIEEFDVTTSGLFSEGMPGIGKDEVLYYDDVRLKPIREANYSLDALFLEGKRKFEKKKEMERKTLLYNNALKDKFKKD